MRFGSRFVASFLLATVLLLPLATFAMCAESANLPAHCPIGCPMAKIMAKMRMQHQQGEHFSAKRDYSCCNMENAAPAPVTESQTVAPVLVAALVVVQVQPLGVESTERTAAGDTSPPALGPPTAALLCTFLI